MSCLSYNSKEVRVDVAGGAHTVTGYTDEDENIILDPTTEDYFESSAGTDGTVERSEIHDDRYMLTLKLKGTSPSVPFFEALGKSRECFPLSISNLSGGSYIGGGNNCRVMNRFGFGAGKKKRAIEVKIQIPNFTGQHI